MKVFPPANPRSGSYFSGKSFPMANARPLTPISFLLKLRLGFSFGVFSMFPPFLFQITQIASLAMKSPSLYGHLKYLASERYFEPVRSRRFVSFFFRSDCRFVFERVVLIGIVARFLMTP